MQNLYIFNTMEEVLNKLWLLLLPLLLPPLLFKDRRKKQSGSR